MKHVGVRFQILVNITECITYFQLKDWVIKLYISIEVDSELNRTHVLQSHLYSSRKNLKHLKVTHLLIAKITSSRLDTWKMTTETYPQQTARFITRDLRVHLVHVVSVTTGCWSTVEGWGDACQQVRYTSLEIQHRDRAGDRDTNTETRALLHNSPTISPTERTQSTFSRTTWRRRLEAA